MPFQADGDRRAPRRIEVYPSAASELEWLQFSLFETHKLPDVPGLDRLRSASPVLRAELAELWADAQECLSEGTVLAARIDALLSYEADTYIKGIPRAATLDNVGLELLSETVADREATLDRLDRLRRDRRLVERYVSIRSRIWELARGEWENRGRAVVEETCRNWSERLARGATVLDLVSPGHYLRKPGHEAVLALLDRRPRVVVSPIYFAIHGGFVIDLTGFVHVGAPAAPVDAERLRRKEAEHIASRLKVLSDGTRVALLRRLAEEPATVMDLARQFRLAQPTVSNHVRMLRDAGLLDATRDGARVLYTAPRQRVAELLSETQRVLVGADT